MAGSLIGHRGKGATGPLLPSSRLGNPFLRSYPRKARQLRIIITVFRLPISGYRSSDRPEKKKEGREKKRKRRREGKRREKKRTRRKVGLQCSCSSGKSGRLIMAQFSQAVAIRPI